MTCTEPCDKPALCVRPFCGVPEDNWQPEQPKLWEDA